MLGLRMSCKYCITDASLRDRLESCYNVTNLSFVEGFTWSVLWSEASDFKYFYLGTCIDELEFVSLFYLS